MTRVWPPPGPAPSASRDPNHGPGRTGAGVSFPSHFLSLSPILQGRGSLFLALTPCGLSFFFPREREKHMMSSSGPSQRVPNSHKVIKVRDTAAQAHGPKFESSRKAGGLGTTESPFSKLLIPHVYSQPAPSAPQTPRSGGGRPLCPPWEVPNRFLFCFYF